MKNFYFEPFILISRGNEKLLSQKLRVKALLKIIDPPFTIYKDKNGKPFVKADIKIGISISHSENVTAVIVAPFEKIGIDLEKIKDFYPEKISERFFKKSEKESIKNSEDFYKIWCKKESYVKMTGKGIFQMTSFNSNYNNLNLIDLSEKCSSLLNENFAFFVCSNYNFNPKIYIE